MSKHRRQSESTSMSKASSGQVDKTIVLVGLMGAGKTTVGRRLAKRLDIPFIDSDHEVEKAAGMSVAEIFESFGEEDFRAGERRVIARLLDGKPQVVATGGGAFVNDETRTLIKEKGISIWLDADIDVLVERTGKRDTRPLLRNGDPKEILTKLANERKPFYAEATHKIVSSNGPHDNVVDDILSVLGVTDT